MTGLKTLALTLAIGGFLTMGMGTVEAAYELNPEVTTTTKALKQATEIGILSYENPAMQNLTNKDAIVVMTFGTTFKDTRAKTINATIEQLQKAHPDTKIVTAYTSHIIIKRVNENEGIKYPTPEEALEQLKADGYTRVALTTLDIIPGVEYSYKKGVFHQYKNNFKKMTFGTPLMYWQGQEEQADDVSEVMSALAPALPKTSKDHAVLLMAHGTPDIANAYYSVMQAKMAELGMDNTYIYTVEGWPSLETVIPKLKAKGVKSVTLVPFMMVAGDHATNDMAGDEDDSHKTILTKEGFKVDTYIHGLGENEAIRSIFVERAEAAWEALEK